MLAIKLLTALLCLQLTVNVLDEVPKDDHILGTDIRDINYQPVPKNDHYFVMFTADWCSYCRVAKTTTVVAVQEKNVNFKYIDVGDNKKWTEPARYRGKSGPIEHKGISSLPTFWLIEKKPDDTETILKEWVGTTTSEVLLKELDSVLLNLTLWKEPNVSLYLSKSLGKLEDKPKVVGLYDGKEGSSHKDRDSLIKHLRTGIHAKNRYSTNFLNTLSDEQLDQLHSKDHKRGI